ncbi:EcsC family protein [Nocardioides donggukensis]|uniref:EcsC family protein n=1 Tax=Nocardioides donggukensis TaxID=2774019 RepID=A0A927K1I5_9ACTN|nr:EcsC family protein [Nocardioides donggukensis]MBD8868084.1 EcsC family protein [Nocardioides donggukensis]
MGFGSSVGKRLAPKLAPRITAAAPELTTGFVRQALDRAIRGVGPLPAADVAARKALEAEGGDVEAAISQIVETHVRYAGAQGFATNLGGLVTATVTIPANITGLALIQCRMVAAIASLRGHDLADPRVRNAVLVCVVGEDAVTELVRRKKLPAPPMALATAPVHDPDLDKVVAAEVASELITKVAGKRLATTIGRRVPVVGGLVGLGADGIATWRIGRYAGRELLPRSRR